jgi:hypothetical protein
LTALAVLILAVAVVAVRAGSSDTVEAATGTIDVLNVGTCYTTSTDVFEVSDCDDGDGNDADTPAEGYNVAGRDTITKADPVFATYAIDPKTSGDQPRVIAKNADVIKISIEDEGRDKRTGKLYGVSGTTSVSAIQAGVISTALKKLADDLEMQDPATPNDPSDDFIDLSGTAVFEGSDGATSTGAIANSGDAEFRLTGTGSTTHPMAPLDDGKVFWFGTVNGGTDLVNLTGTYINLDEDLASGDGSTTAPWMKVTASLPFAIDVDFIYYQTSEEEEIVGGLKQTHYDGSVELGEDDPRSVPSNSLAPDFVDDEVVTDDNLDPDALVLRVTGDGETAVQNLWLKEDGRFSGRYEGYLILTDADGDGKCDDDGDGKTADNPTPEVRCNWGIPPTAATGAEMEDAAVIGVESDPITITYRNSNGDPKTTTIQIDKTPPTIQIDSPVHQSASKDDSPDLIGSFNDGGGSGLREDSFWVYADNRPDGKTDENPIWDFQVHDKTDRPEMDVARGHVCVDADEDGTCDASSAVAVLRAHYFGYSDEYQTFGVIPSNQVYKPEDIDPDENDGDEFKREDAEDFDDGADSGTFDTVIRIDFTPDPVDNNRYNHEIDIQAVVMDIAGNIGFSDSEPSDPTFIHDFGTTTKDSKRAPLDRHNVVGWYSRHVYHLDDVDPKYEEDQSATGFILDADGEPMRTNSGLMVVFDGKIDASTVGVGTFDVQLDDGSDATVIAAQVKDAKVYLQLEEELAPNATPKVDLAAGQAISDRAGNESTESRLEGIELSDGILPTFTVTLSGGTGLNEDIDGEGPSELTKNQMTLSVSANEAIQGAPKFAVVCSNLYWGNNEEDNNVAKYASNRTGHFTSTKIGDAAPKTSKPHTGVPIDRLEMVDGENVDQGTMCPDHVNDPEDAENDKSTYFDVAVTSAHARPGNNWEYQWSNLSGDQAVENGKLSVIVWGRDRSSYETGDGTVYNYSASTSNFVYDTVLKAAWKSDDGGELVPAKDENVFEVRPFVLLDFNDKETTVDVTTFEVDGTDFTADLMKIEDNDFVWWPEPLAYGTYEVYVEANDAANNQDDYTYSFTVKERAPFVLNLLAGWNSVSFPSNPVDRALHAVFTEPAIDQVIGWDVTEPVSPWRMASRVDGVWTTSDDVATLNDVEARYGYWVHSMGFVTQAVKLAGKGDRATDGQPNPADIPTDEGWNFVGVVDVDGDQTQDDAGETLRNSNDDPITAADYLGNYTRAYTWDHINNTWDVLKRNEGMVIGSGVWVYYTKGHDIAP